MQTIVIALPEKTVLDAVEFDTASAACDGCAAKGILVEMSDSSPRLEGSSTGGRRAEEQGRPAALPLARPQAPGRWCGSR